MDTIQAIQEMAYATMAKANVGADRPQLLLLEDELMIALEIQGIIEEAGVATVHIAGNADTARSMAAEFKGLAGAILDVNLNDGTSLGLAAELRERDIPIAFATGYEPGDDFLARFNDVPLLAKPFDVGDLITIVRKLISHREAEGV